MVLIFIPQLLYLGVAFTIFASFMTWTSSSRRHGSQPATHEHLQNIVDLVDEWSPTVYWGHKSDDGEICHAGTVDHPLPEVMIDRLYSGEKK
jgi:hypothetical protein